MNTLPRNLPADVRRAATVEAVVALAATLFIGTVQGLVMQSLITGDMERMCADAPRVFAIYQRGIDAVQESTP